MSDVAWFYSSSRVVEQISEVARSGVQKIDRGLQLEIIVVYAIVGSPDAYLYG